MTEFKKDETNRMLGRQLHTCKICGVQGNFETYLVREMMQGTREEFVYFACGQCKCLQIAQIPENLGDYYGEDYYSMQVEEFSDVTFDVPVTSRAKVLDVGCGAGAWLLQKASAGWGNLYGCDPFLNHDRYYGDRVHIRSCSIHEMEGDGSFDIIQMSDSFEHMADPLEALKSARRLLKDDGVLYMTIPTWPNIAFERYGPHWYQLDAPRHLFLHSKESLAYLARNAGMMIFNRKYNSNRGQFVRSYLYRQGIPYWEQRPYIEESFTKKELETLEMESAVANEQEYGDHMRIYLRRNAAPVAERGNKVIFQRFKREESRYDYPYPPVYREPDTDYLCFTMDKNVYSDHWKVQMVEDLGREALEPHLAKYENRFEMRQNQIQMGSVFAGNPAQNVLTTLTLEELPMVKMVPEKFEPTADENGNYKYVKNPVYQKGKYGGRPLLLTIGVPVSNQIGTIDRCLFHIKPLLDELDAELVVVDTGSTDGTIEVCKSYGARVYKHLWHDNMSAVRNEAIRHARGLWYMSIDDDEWFEDVEDILHFFQTGEYRQYDYASYIQRNYKDSGGKVFGDHYTSRMARITPELHFEGRIHDALSVSGRYKQLLSYAHHYGFVNDRPEKMQAKFLRNATILMYDVYEYPEDVRYLFQLANEYKAKEENTAMALFSQCISLCIQLGKSYRGRQCVGGLASSMYEIQDERLFGWMDCLNKVFSLNMAERALNAFLMASLAYTKNKPAREVLSYFDDYEVYLEEYGKDPASEKRDTFYSIPAVESDFFISDAMAVGCCACLRLGEEKRALGLLERFSLETAENTRIAVLDEGFAAGPEFYEALCRKLTPLQWEEWSDMVMDAFAAGMTRYAVAEQQKSRFPMILSHVSVSAVQNWLTLSELGKRDKVKEKLIEYALEAGQNERFAGIETPLSELALCARVLKEAYVRNRIQNPYKEVSTTGEKKALLESDREAFLDTEEKKTAKYRQLLKAYILAEGAFAERYYRQEFLLDEADTTLPPETRAVYRMAAALSAGVANSENVALLKQALVIFPPFHQEIRSILTELK